MAANPEMMAFEDPEFAQAEQERTTLEANDRLLSAIEEREGTSNGGDTDNINSERATAIEYYLGKPFGNEIEGRSQVVSKDVFDTVEWIKPSLLRIFAGGDSVAEFQPQNEDDVPAAKQESDYVDYVIQRKNPWFMLAHEWFTDALLTKNAYAMAYWDKKTDQVLETYSGLADDQLALIAQDQEVQITAHSAYPGPMMMLHDVEVRRVKETGCAKICILPPERCLVAQDATGMSVREHSDFFEYWEYKTLSELRTMGLDVPDDVSDSAGVDRGVVDEVRDEQNSAYTVDNSDRSVDPAMRKVKVRMVWIKNDHNGDGIAEFRYCVVIGREIFVNKECTGIPVASIVPYPMPHRHIGLSMYDVLSDLQIIKSAMLRAGIDNQFLANNGRTAVDKNRVNLDDMLVSRPGGVVRVDGSPHEGILPFTHPQTTAGTISMIEYLDGIRQDRGGVQKPMAGADINSISAQPGTVAQLASAASQKIELIARIFAEGVKELFQIVHEITLSNPTVVDKVQLSGKWVTVDPRTWKKRSDMTLTVGLGVGNRQQQVVALQGLMAMQEKALGVGLTSLPKVYNALSKYVEALGFASGSQFFDEPQEGQTFQPSPPYQIKVAEINAQAKMAVEQMETQVALLIAKMKDEADAQKVWFEQQTKLMNDREERALRAYSEATERAQELRLNQAE